MVVLSQWCLSWVLKLMLCHLGIDISAVMLAGSGCLICLSVRPYWYEGGITKPIKQWLTTLTATRNMRGLQRPVAHTNLNLFMGCLTEDLRDNALALRWSRGASTASVVVNTALGCVSVAKEKCWPPVLLLAPSSRWKNLQVCKNPNGLDLVLLVFVF